MFTFSCETEPEPGSNSNNGSGNNGGNTFTGDELSKFLVLDGAGKITGDLTEASDMLLKMNVEDTIYIIKSSPYGARVVVRHDGRHDITGFYIGVDNSSFYYDVPVVDAVAQDSTDVIYINVAVPEDADVDYPLTIPIKVQPHGPSGEPLDEFDREVTIEDPEADNKCPLTIPFTTGSTNLDRGWLWLFTYGYDNTGKLFYEEAPGTKKISNYKTGGCCNDDGTSSTVANDPYCFEKYSNGTPNPRWRSIDVEHYFEWKYDILWFYDNGTFIQDNLSFQTNYRPSESDFCNNEAAYDFQKSFFHKSGKHDFTPGAEYLKVTYDVTDPPVYGKIIRGGELLYSCHVMQLTFDVEGQRWVMGFTMSDHFDISDDGTLVMKDWD